MGRRILVLAVLAATAVTLALVTVGSGGSATPKPTPAQLTPKKGSPIVVIYQENHNFDNPYGGWGGADQPANRRCEAAQVDPGRLPFPRLEHARRQSGAPPPAVNLNRPAAAAGVRARVPRHAVRHRHVHRADRHDVPAADRLRSGERPRQGKRSS